MRSFLEIDDLFVIRVKIIVVFMYKSPVRGKMSDFLSRAPIRLPENVVVDVVIVTKKEGVLTHRVIAEELTSSYKVSYCLNLAHIKLV